ncbi:sugar ABC transporter permease [Acidihalobacter aeolianus]|uniref:Sugar ABC transporter permease n=1 Tax=Acidihalobacter aeolianus TaxID=2792603 RepID=A0A1D8K924_9GAMM|nr:ABC transporter permease [Acidihalobacter aeolianus]AOV17474.1 sugar ABC transporter permease [Acidihalobacter aeolianus]
MTTNAGPSLRRQFAIQRRVIWAMVMRETITMYGREGLGVLWIVAEPAMFVLGVMVLFSFMEANYVNNISPAEYLAVSYPTLLFWRNGTSKTTKAIDVNRALLHHQPIRPIDVVYARIILTFASGAAAFFVLYPVFTFLGITRLPYDWFDFAMGYLLVIWFSFAFVMIMSSLSELSESIERTSHIILYLMLPVTGVFFPLYVVPQPYREWLMYFPLIDAVEFFHAGYFGPRMPTYYNLGYTVVVLIGMTLFGYALAELAIKRVKIMGGA